MIPRINTIRNEGLPLASSHRLQSLTFDIPATKKLLDKKRRPKEKNAYTHFPLMSFEGMAGLAKHVGTGNAVCVSQHGPSVPTDENKHADHDNYKHADYFIQQILGGIDLDAMSVEALSADPDVSRYFGLIYATPSDTPDEPHSRALTIFETPIQDAARARLANMAILHHFRHLKDYGLDEKCVDTSRMYYGSSHGRQIINEGAYLPDAVLDQWIAEYQAFEAQQAAEQARHNAEDTVHRLMPALKPAKVSDDLVQRRKEAYARQAIAINASVMRNTPEGSGHYGGRDNALIALLCKSLNVPYTLEINTLSDHEIIDTLSRAAAATGLSDSDISKCVRSALSYPREKLRGIRINFDENNRPGRPDTKAKPGPQKSAQADNWHSAITELDEDAAQAPALAARVMPLQLPDDVIIKSLDTNGFTVTSESQYLYGAMARGKLPPIFILDCVNKVRESDGIKTPADSDAYTEMAKLGILRKEAFEFFRDLHPILEIDTCVCGTTQNAENAPAMGGDQRKNSTRGRKPQAYSLVSPDEFKRLMFGPIARKLVKFHPEKLLMIDEGLKALVKDVLDGLAMWKKFHALNLAVVRSFLKKNAQHADAVYEAILAIPITDTGLLEAMKLDAQEIAIVQAVALNEDQSLIGLKNRLVLRLYEMHLESLDNPHTTLLPDNAPRVGEAWLKAFHNARMQPYNSNYLWNHERNDILGIEDKRSAKRAAARAGIISTPRGDKRTFTVQVLGDSTPTWDAVKRQAKETAKHVDKAHSGRAQYIRSFDEAGRLIGSAAYTEADHPYGFNIGVRFEVELELPSLITVLDLAQLADGKTPAAEQSDTNPDGNAQTANKPKRTRITPARLHNKNWVLARLLAPFCKTDDGLWFNPLNPKRFDTDGVLITFDTFEAVLKDLKAFVLPAFAEVS